MALAREAVVLAPGQVREGPGGLPIATSRRRASALQRGTVDGAKPSLRS